MSSLLTAQFQFQHPRGPLIEGAVTLPTNRFYVTALLGPSGCGKTTILRCLAGLERPRSGQILWNEELWFCSHRGVWKTPQQRRIGFLFQDYALFPHRTVEENLGFGLSGLTSSQQTERTHQLMDRFQLQGLESRLPHQLSGGQQQRVALARTLAPHPQLLLLDEPLSALDSNLRRELRQELRELLAPWQVPVLLVTHDHEEVLSLADHVIMLEAGKTTRCGSVPEILSPPGSPSLM